MEFRRILVPVTGTEADEEAVRLAERACELTECPAPLPLSALAEVYAGTGRLDEAVAAAAGDSEMIEELRARLKRYRSRTASDSPGS